MQDRYFEDQEMLREQEYEISDRLAMILEVEGEGSSIASQPLCIASATR